MPNKLDALFRPVDNSWLVIFRIAFGLLMTEEAVRYLVFGFATGLYVEPRFHFQYYGFTWVEPWSGIGMYVHFAVLVVLGLMITFGLYYRVAATLFFFGFTYVFLLDQARYLNHFYLVVLLAFWMIFLPAHRTLSLDARRRPDFRREVAPAWTLWLFRAQLGVVYVYAAVAKMNMDWLSAEPLRMWLSEKDRTQKPIIGPLLAREETAWVMSYGGLLLDLLCVPFLLWRRTRIFAFLAVLSFHAINYLVFSIGIFPWLMLASTLVFFEPDLARRVLRKIGLFRQEGPRELTPPSRIARRTIFTLLALYAVMQLTVPLRHFLYPGDVNWTEEGHRFSWRMKLRSKSGWAVFEVRDPATGRVWAIDPEKESKHWGPGIPAAFLERPDATYLTDRQQRKMTGLPDMIIQFAHHLRDEFEAAGYDGVEVRVRARTSLNGRRHQPLVDPSVDLAREPRNLAPADWILPLDEPLRPPPEIRRP